MKFGAWAALTRREWTTFWTDRGGYVFRAAYAGGLLLFAAATWGLIPGLLPSDSDLTPFALRSVFGWFCRSQLVLATALASLTFARAVCREQERGTLDLLLLSPLTRMSILSAKLTGEFLGLACLVAAGIPVVLLLLPLGGLSPLEIVVLQALLLAHVLAVGGLSVAFAALLGRAFPVMLCTWAAVAVAAIGPSWVRAAAPGARWLWASWEAVSTVHLMEGQLASVSASPAMALRALLTSAFGSLLACGLGSLVLERRVLRGSRPTGIVGRRIRRWAGTPRGSWFFRKMSRGEHPLVDRERSIDRHAWFYVLWLVLVVIYGAVVRREFLNPRESIETHLAISLAGLATGWGVAALLGALSVGVDRRRGLLETLLAVGVSPEDLVRARWRGLFQRAACLLSVPAVHFLYALAKEVPESAPWRVPAAFVGLTLGTAFLTLITLWTALKIRRVEIAAFAALVMGIPGALVVASFLGSHLVSLTLGIPLVLGTLLGGYAALIRRTSRFVLS